MWVLTTAGFFSIVEKPGDRAAGRLTIRARVRGDLERLRAEALPGLGKIETGAGTDYPFRAVAPRAEVAAAIAKLVTDLDYPNFKDAVAARQGSDRADAYGRVWEALRDLTEDGAAPRDARPARASWRAAPKPGRPIAYGGVLVDAAGYVLLRRPKNDYDGYVWTFPKGRPDPGETPEACALRETREETGYAARILAPLPGVFAGGTTDTIFFLMEPVGTKGPTDGETSDTLWAEPDVARVLIGKTRNEPGRRRDRAVLAAAAKAIKARSGG
ncbi:MAG: NUDIX domain-containing protein [Rhodospirillales bacterium]